MRTVSQHVSDLTKHARINDDAIGNQQSKETREFSQRRLNSTTNDWNAVRPLNVNGKPTMGASPDIAQRLSNWHVQILY